MFKKETKKQIKMNTNNTSGSTPPFRIGQRVVCIRGYEGESCIILGEIPITGREYTVRGFDPSSKVGGMYLNEIISEWFCGNEVSFLIARFAPIEENKERIRYVAVSETLRGRAEEVVVESCNLS